MRPFGQVGRLTLYKMTHRLPFLLALALPVPVLCQTAPVTLPPGTQLPVSIPDHLPMRVGQPVRAQLLYPVYRDNQLILPAHTVVTGSIVALNPDHARRVKSRLRFDFTPFRTPVVRFDTIVAPDGARTPILTSEATSGAPVYRVVRSPAVKGGLIGRLFAQARQQADDTIQSFIGPNKSDRFVQLVYGQLPVHPQRIARDTAWTVETSAPVNIAALAAPPAPPAASSGHLRLVHPVAPKTAVAEGSSEQHPGWILQAYLDQALSSDSSTANQVIHATVAEPVLNPDGSVAVPQGAVLSGTVTQARPARRFARVGTLRFNFSQLTLPGQQPQTVRTTLTGVDSSSSQELNIDSEGQATPKTENKVVIPALLLLLAARPLDRDGGRDHHMFGKEAVASGSLGLITFIIGTAAQQPNLAAGFGYYSAALSIFPRWIAKGAPVAFPKDTRIVIQTTGTRSVALKSATATQ